MRLLFLISAAALLSACQTTPKNEADWNVPLTVRTVGPAYADYVIERADANKDGRVTLVEWTNAGGTKKSFLLVDHKDNQMTPRDFRTPSGVRVLRIEF